jgi:hypothetical protein
VTRIDHPFNKGKDFDLDNIVIKEKIYFLYFGGCKDYIQIRTWEEIHSKVLRN